MVRKYPELEKYSSENYNLKRTLIVGVRNIEIKLYSSKEDICESNNIILIKNEKGESNAIPLFSNCLRKYWNFENEAKNFKSTKYNSIFEKEIVGAIDRLKLNDTLGTVNTILFEMFHSILHFQQLNEFDKERLQTLGNQLTSSDLYTDDGIECEKRNEINCNQILNGIIKSSLVYNYNAYYDSFNNRVFQFEYSKRRNKKIKELGMKIYRFGCDVTPMIL